MENEKLAQAADKFPKRLISVAHGTFTVSAKSDALLASFGICSSIYMLVGFLCKHFSIVFTHKFLNGHSKGFVTSPLLKIIKFNVVLVI